VKTFIVKYFFSLDTMWLLLQVMGQVAGYGDSVQKGVGSVPLSLYLSPHRSHSSFVKHLYLSLSLFLCLFSCEGVGEDAKRQRERKI
jgi:hypothetical protein